MKQQTAVEWLYFFGGASGNTFDRYYSAVINGVQCEKHSSNKGTMYAVGNIDTAKKKFKTEKQLVKYLTV